jgi:hypothetical protein
MSFFHVGIDGSGNSDASYTVLLPGTGGSQYAILGQMSTSIFAANQFIEPGGQGFITVPVINGVAAFTGFLQGNTKALASVTANLIGYKLPCGKT